MEGCSELAKEPVLKTGARKGLRVRVPPPPPSNFRFTQIGNAVKKLQTWKNQGVEIK